ncbi:MAG: hypothetical protein KGI64_01645 [Xanthomonadaceae bacterium]|nr:hypothetical protein [Xanthomonadaceae bacterium]MDE1885725.1 hypothetical protein [Xanthomonadaceae bacterium]MDE2083544.1 hypothetical protein [Xanthomonadaceae bacterium]MDE2258277.1 hypothetical protein [Xanthomonadaceae bacterium]
MKFINTMSMTKTIVVLAIKSRLIDLLFSMLLRPLKAHSPAAEYPVFLGNAIGGEATSALYAEKRAFSTPTRPDALRPAAVAAAIVKSYTRPRRIEPRDRHDAWPGY